MSMLAPGAQPLDSASIFATVIKYYQQAEGRPLSPAETEVFADAEAAWKSSASRGATVPTDAIEIFLLVSECIPEDAFFSSNPFNSDLAVPFGDLHSTLGNSGRAVALSEAIWHGSPQDPAGADDLSACFIPRGLEAALCVGELGISVRR